MTGYQESITDQSFNGQIFDFYLSTCWQLHALIVTTMSQLSQRPRVLLCRGLVVVPATGVTK